MCVVNRMATAVCGPHCPYRCVLHTAAEEIKFRHERRVKKAKLETQDKKYK